MPALFRFKHFQSRLLAFFLIPLVVVLSAVYIAVTRANTSNAISVITADLQNGARNFTAAIAEQNNTLAIAGDALSGDFAFKSAFSLDDLPTMLSVLDNLLGRLSNADFIVMVDDKDDTIIADTLRPGLSGVAPPWLYLIEAARALDRRGEYPEAKDVVILEGHPYHLTVLPLLTPDLVAWIGIGFEIDQDFTTDFKQSISAEVSVLFKDGEKQWAINGSTMPDATHADLQNQFNNMPGNGLNSILTLAGEDYVTLANPISNDALSVEVVLQRSLAAQLAPYEALRQLLFSIFAIGLVVLALGVMVISRNVTFPVLQLAKAAKRIQAGDYQQTVQLPLTDEIGDLALAFNDMAKGLAEKEKVRNLLGKVVSPEIANELLSKDIELGGEERVVTVLFSDVRGFTSLCEGQSPRLILSLLNEYFSAVSGVIEIHGGVVDKYIGDAVMALYGAPVFYADSPSRAIRSALAMYEALGAVNASFVQRGLKPISIGVGINTDKVVVGNMGSQSRLNYTVIGDGVNLASRLEGLTKRYGANIIVSEQCAAAAPDFHYLELDLVRVTGKQEPVRILEPLLASLEANPAVTALTTAFQAFLHQYRAGDFAAAKSLLHAFEATFHTAPLGFNPALVALYHGRLAQLLADPPAVWDGIHTFTGK